MKITLTQDLDFIHKKGVRECYIENVNGAILLKAGNFTQNLKKSELEKIMMHTVDRPVPAPTPVKETKAKEDDEIKVGSNVRWHSKRDGDMTGKVVEMIEDGTRARVKDDEGGAIFKVAVDLLSL